MVYISFFYIYSIVLYDHQTQPSAATSAATSAARLAVKGMNPLVVLSSCVCVFFFCVYSQVRSVPLFSDILGLYIL